MLASLTYGRTISDSHVRQRQLIGALGGEPETAAVNCGSA